MRKIGSSTQDSAACGFANGTPPISNKWNAPDPRSRDSTELVEVKRQSAFTLIELLISLAICASLLTATGVAIDAAFQGYQVNQEQATLTQRSRLCLYRMLSQIRVTKEHAPYTSALASQFATGQIVTDTGISMFLDDNTELSYVYDATHKQLQQISNGSTHVLMDGVDKFQVKLEPMRSANSIKTGAMTYDLLMRATILLTVRTNSQTSSASETTGSQTVTLSSSVEPRRNIW